MSEFENKKELIRSCVVAGINRYMKEVLVPKGYINIEKFDQEGMGLGTELNQEKHRIADAIASRLQKPEQTP